MAVEVKTLNGLAYASVKTRNGLAVASISRINNLDVTSGSFIPTDIAGCQLWLPADYIVGPSDGDPLSTWPDNSGNARDATQSGSSRPTFRTNIINGLPAVLFDGATNFMATASDTYVVQTIFVVSYRNGTGSDYDGFITTRVSPNSNKVPPSDGNYGFTGGGFPASGNTYVATESLAVGPNGYYSHVAVDGVSGSTADFEGYTVGLTAAASTWHVFVSVQTSASASGDKNFCIGADAFSPASRFLDGFIAEIIVYDSALSTGDRETVEDYLGAKYGITITH